MLEPKQKRLKEQDPLILAEDADHAAIRLWLQHMKLQSEQMIYQSWQHAHQRFITASPRC